MPLYRLDILTPYRRLYAGEVESILFRTDDGEIVVLAGHEPIAAPVVPCVLQVRGPDGNKYAAAAEGFVTITQTKVQIFLDAAEWAVEIDKKRAEEALERAEKRLVDGTMSWELTRVRYAAARARTRLATVAAATAKRSA